MTQQPQKLDDEELAKSLILILRAVTLIAEQMGTLVKAAIRVQTLIAVGVGVFVGTFMFGPLLTTLAERMFR